MEDSYVLQLHKTIFKEFYLCFCGYAECKPLHSYGPATRPNYIIHYVLDGKGMYQVGEQKYYLSKGQGFLIEPDVLTFYQADKDDPWTYLWIGFDGSDAKKRIQSVGLNSRRLIYQCSHDKELKEIVFDMLKHTQTAASNLYHLQSMLYQFFSVLARDTVVDASGMQSKENEHVMAAINYIRNCYADGINVEDVAEAIHVNRSYLYSIFKNTLELSPKEFLTKFRASRAKDQLVLTDFSVEYIAESCGYQSALAFSRAFKREIGVTPSQFREQRRREKKETLESNQDKLLQIKNKQ